MNRTAKFAIAAAVLAGAQTAPACNSVAVAQAPPCGGNSKTHPAPIDCENSKTVGNITGTVRLVVDDTGYALVTAVISVPGNVVPPPLYLQVKAHRGISSNTGFEGVTDVFDGNTASAELQLPLDPAAGCASQVDIKIVPGQPTLDHVSPVFRVAAPLVFVENCGAPATTSPATTTPPSVSPTTGPEVTSPTPATASTVPGPTVTSGPTHLPATGRSIGEWTGLAIAFLLVGTIALIAVASRPRSALAAFKKDLRRYEKAVRKAEKLS